MVYVCVVGGNVLQGEPIYLPTADLPVPPAGVLLRLPMKVSFVS